MSCKCISRRFWLNVPPGHQVSVRYLQEYAPLGTAGGLHHFRDQIRAGSPDAFVVMNGDVCAEFPLQEMLEFHSSKDKAVSLV